MESLAKEGAGLGRDELLRRLMALAEAHRGEMNTRVEYDRALWQLFSELGKEPTAAELSRTPDGATPR